MKTFVKKWMLLLVAMCIMFSIFSINTFAVGSSSITCDGGLFIPGDEITVTARICTYSYQPMYKVEGYITYDPKVVEFVSGDNCDLLTEGKIKMTLQADGKTMLVQKLVFKALIPGKSVVTLENIRCYDSKSAYATVDNGDTSITVINTSEFASDNANLRSLRVSQGMLVPSFSRDVTSYEVVLNNEKEELLVSVGTEHAKSTYVIEGGKTMELGINKRVIVVTAENGTQKRYTLNVIRLDAGENAPEADSLLLDGDRVRVIVDDKPLYIEEDFPEEVVPSGFRKDTHVYNNLNLPCVTDDNIVMFYLSNFDKTEFAFYVAEDRQEFTKLITANIAGEEYHILPVKGDQIPNGYSETTVTIGEQSLPAYKSEDANLSDFVLFYAKDPSGNVDFYRYDTLENNIQRATGMGLTFGDVAEEDNTPKTFIEFIKNLDKDGIIVIACISVVILILLATIIILIVRIITVRRKEMLANEADYDDTDFFDINFIMTVDKEDK